MTRQRAMQKLLHARRSVYSDNPAWHLLYRAYLAVKFNLPLETHFSTCRHTDCKVIWEQMIEKKRKESIC